MITAFCRCRELSKCTILPQSILFPFPVLLFAFISNGLPINGLHKNNKTSKSLYSSVGNEKSMREKAFYH